MCGGTGRLLAPQAHHEVRYRCPTASGSCVLARCCARCWVCANARCQRVLLTGTDPISGMPLTAATIPALSPKAIPAQRLRCGYRAVSRGAAGCPCARQQCKAGSVTVYLGQKPSPVRWPCVPAGAGNEPLFTLIPPYEKYFPADCRYWRRSGWPVVCPGTAGARHASHCVRQKPWPWRAHEHAPR